MPGQNTPATTTQATIEQGMKVFTAIYKRTFRSLSKEFKKLFRLNSIYEENFIRAQQILDEPIGPQDYNRDSYDVCPTADPTAVSTTQKLQKASQLMELIPLGTINIMEATKRILEGQEQPNLNALMQQPQPQVDPKVQAVQAKMQMDKEKHTMDMAGKQKEMQFKQIEMLMEGKFKEQEQAMELKFKEMEFAMEARHQQTQHSMDMTQSVQEHGVAMKQGEQKMELAQKQHNMKKEQMNDKAVQQRANSGVAKPSSNSSSKGSSSSKNK